MIVPSMTAPEMVKEILLDFPAVQVKASYLLETLRRPAIKSKHRYAEKMFEYKSPQHNRWNIFAEHHIKHRLLSYLVRYSDNYGINAVMVCTNYSLSHYTSHFFKRYHERNLNNQPLDINALIQHFMRFSAQDQMHYYARGEDNRAYFFARGLEGVKLGYAEKVDGKTLAHYKTFITLDMLRNNQIVTSNNLEQALLEDLRARLGYKLKKLGIAA
jgi:hypothetical protein